MTHFEMFNLYIFLVCTDGVMLANQCLKFITDETLSWEDAKARCESQNTRLAVLNDPAAFKDYVRLNYGKFTFKV